MTIVYIYLTKVNIIIYKLSLVLLYLHINQNSLYEKTFILAYGIVYKFST
ncbi:hypothetical protein ABIB30_003042 [Pedobacter sp. UYP1]